MTVLRLQGVSHGIVRAKRKVLRDPGQPPAAWNLWLCEDWDRTAASIWNVVAQRVAGPATAHGRVVVLGFAASREKDARDVFDNVTFEELDVQGRRS